jgi:hypothetical protein
VSDPARVPLDQVDNVGVFLKMVNEAGGRADVRRIERRSPESLTRRCFCHALDAGLMLGTGAITPSGYRWLGDWLTNDDLPVRGEQGR